MLEVKRSMEVAAAPAAVWAVISEFGGIAEWHPACAASSAEEVGGDTHRTITIADGGRIVEKLESHDATTRSLSYSIVESPLPVENYLSHMSIEARDGGSTIHWSGQFNAKGAPDETATEIIAGIYDMGLAALKKKFG